jgi:hypothetical protein
MVWSEKLKELSASEEELKRILERLCSGAEDTDRVLEELKRILERLWSGAEGVGRALEEMKRLLRENPPEYTESKFYGFSPACRDCKQRRDSCEDLYVGRIIELRVVDIPVHRFLIYYCKRSKPFIIEVVRNGMV